jgi:hypothetical protein
VDAISEVDAAIKRGPDATDTHLLTTDVAAPGAATCLEMDTDGSVILAAGACGVAGGEANTLASPDVGAEVDLINSVPKTGTALNLTSLEADHFSVTANIITIDSHAGTDITADLEEEGAINATAVTGNASSLAVMFGTGASTAGWDLTPAIDCTDCTNITATHADTITWTGTSILESGVAFQFGDGSDATVTHTYANTGTDNTIAFSSGVVNVTAGELQQGASPVVVDSDIGSAVQAWDAELDTIAALTETNGNVMFVAGGVWTSDPTPAIVGTDFTGTATAFTASNVTTNANLTGDVTSVGNAATIADSVTVTGWVMGASTATTPATTDDDTSLATTAYVKNQEHTLCKTIETLVAADDDVPLFYFNGASTIIKIGCDSQAAATVSVQDGGATDVDADLVCSTGGAITWDSSLSGTTSFTDGERLEIDTISASSPTWTTVCVVYTTP